MLLYRLSRRGGVSFYQRFPVASFSASAPVNPNPGTAPTSSSSFRSPRCRRRCAWPNPCPCFPMPARSDSKPKPDYSAALLSSASKEKMYQMHKQNPEVNTVDKLAAEYRIRKQRVLAILWLKEMEKEEEARRGEPLDDRLEKFFEGLHPTYNKALRGEKHVADIELEPEGLDGKSRDQILQEVSEKQEQIFVDEFVQRMEYNKKRLSGLIPNHHERPSDGWSYTVELLDEKRGRSGGRRFVTEADGTSRGLNEVEKILARREKVLARRRPTAPIKPGSLVSLKAISFAACLRQGMLDIYAGRLEPPGRPYSLAREAKHAPAHHIWHGMRDSPGLIHIYPRKDKTFGRMVKAMPTVKAFRPRTPAT